MAIKYRKEGKFIEKFIKKVRTCCNCESHYTYIDSRGYEVWHKHKCKKMICTKYLCRSCYDKDRYINGETYSNIIKLMRPCRTGGKNPNSTQVFGDNVLELACILYGWEDLNKKHDNYTTGTPIDCYDPKTGLYHQVQGRYYESDYRRWSLGHFEREWKKKKYENMVGFCISEEGLIVERIYKFQWKEIAERMCATIIKNPCRGGWYEKYRITDKDEIKRANDIWEKILHPN